MRVLRASRRTLGLSLLLAAGACSEEQSGPAPNSEGAVSPSSTSTGGGATTSSDATGMPKTGETNAMGGSGGAPGAGAGGGSAAAGDLDPSPTPELNAGADTNASPSPESAADPEPAADPDRLGNDEADAGQVPDPSGATDAGTTEPIEPIEPITVDPTAPLTPIAFFPSKDRTNACRDASVSIEFNRTPSIQAGGQIQIHDASGAVFDSVTSNPRDGLYFSDLAKRSSNGQAFDSDVLDVVFNTVVFQPKGTLTPGMTYYVTVDEGMIADADGNTFSVKDPETWRFTVREQEPPDANSYTLAADGSGDYCSLEGVLQALPDNAQTPRLITVARGVYPGIIRMSDSNVHFQGAGVDESVFSHKNAATMNSSREGIVLTGSDITFEDLTIFNTYLQDSNGQQAEALYVAEDSHRVFLNNVHLRSHQDTLRVDGDTVFMKGGKISGSTDPLWGYGGFYCDGCELSSRTSGHAFVVARSTLGFGMVNCSVTKELGSVNNTSLAQYHDGSEPGKIAFVNCTIDDHIVGWRRPENNAWYEYGNTDLQTGAPVTFGGTQLTTGSPQLDALSSAQSWLGWSP
jgi:hypothetical protein